MSAGTGWDWIRVALRSELHPVPRFIFLALASWTNSDGEARRPVHRLEGDTGYCSRTIRDALVALVNGGWLEPIDHRRGLYKVREGAEVSWPMERRSERGSERRSERGSMAIPEKCSDDLVFEASPKKSKKTKRSKKKTERDLYIGQFPDFWALYPRKVKRQAALTRWSKLIASGVDPDVLLASVGHYGEHLARIGTEARYIPHCSTWLNSGQYTDHLEACTSACECLESRGGRRESIEEEAARIVAEYPELGLLSSSGGLIVHDGGRE